MGGQMVAVAAIAAAAAIVASSSVQTRLDSNSF